jgi:tRNA threonylcarbamoyladenosine biosynthesis protein TsaB
MDLSIDTASDLASIALSREGELAADRAWRCQRNHTVELLPAIDRLLMDSGVDREELTAVFVSLGPGMYTGLRVGISVAQGLARALSLPALGVGRLELDAYPHAHHPGPVVAVHRAGRGELAWAAYQENPWRELTPPHLSKSEELADATPSDALVTGEVDETLRALLKDRNRIAPHPEEGRARSLALLGHLRLSEGAIAEPALLRPIYLRPPAIGPQSRPGID